MVGLVWAIGWLSAAHIKLNRVEIISIMNLDNSTGANLIVSSMRALNSQSTKPAFVYSTSWFICRRKHFCLLSPEWSPKYTARNKGAGCWVANKWKSWRQTTI